MDCEIEAEEGGRQKERWDSVVDLAKRHRGCGRGCLRGG